MNKVKKVIGGMFVMGWSALMLPTPSYGAIGCVLSNPAEDLKYLFSEMMSYKEHLKEFPSLKGGDRLFASLKERLGSDVDPVYETYETPYTVYSVFKGPKKIGVVHGVNVPGKGGVIQVFLSVDPVTAEIRKMFFQRLESPAAGALKQKTFRAQFEGLSLADFYKHDYFSVVQPGAEVDKVAKILPPAVEREGQADVAASMRGVRKNLILLDLFMFDKRYEPFFEKAKEALQRKAPGGKKS